MQVFKLYSKFYSDKLRVGLQGQNTVLILQCQMPAELTGGNSQRKHLKLIWWEKNGFWIAQKIIEKGRWPWPETNNEIIIINGFTRICVRPEIKA